ncbi:MAG: hypothetical protein ACT4PT_07685 [Methanobacteriota archaeon]
MLAQYRPDVARVAEETVVNLKDLESRIEILKNDLAQLCLSIGHPEAARVAATPARWVPQIAGIGAQGAFGSQGVFGQVPIGSQSPYGSQTPFGAQSLMYPNVPNLSPFATFGLTNPLSSAFANPLVNPFATQSFVNPLAAQSFVNPLAAQSFVNPLAAQFRPF